MFCSKFEIYYLNFYLGHRFTDELLAFMLAISMSKYSNDP